MDDNDGEQSELENESDGEVHPDTLASVPWADCSRLTLELAPTHHLQI